MKKNRKKILIFTISLLFIGLVLAFYILNNVNALFIITEGLDRPSRAYYILIERIYSLSARKKVGDKIWRYVENNKNTHLQNLYIQVLGITGADIPIGSLIEIYSQCQHDMNRRSTVSKIIDTMGLLGYDSRQITQHYYPGSVLKKLYK